MSPSKKPFRSRLISSTKGLDYEFLDSGNNRKLERFGSVILNRPEILAKWKPNLSKSRWDSAHWYFFEDKGKKGVWKANKAGPRAWEVKYKIEDKTLRFKAELTAFKHIGIFPEQAANWNYLYRIIQDFQAEEPKVLNLFAYTGAASLVASSAGAATTHVDSVKQVVNWAKENAALNQIESIRWILEDARKFVDKAIRRNEKFNGIILDPPAFGLGAKKEVWKLESDLASLLESCMKILEHRENFFVLNTYSPKLGLLDLKSTLSKTARFPKKFESALLGLSSSTQQDLELGNLIRFTS